MFDLISMQDTTETCQHTKLIGAPVRLELNFTYLLQHVTELIVLGAQMSSVSLDKFGAVGKNI